MKTRTSESLTRSIVLAALVALFPEPSKAQNLGMASGEGKIEMIQPAAPSGALPEPKYAKFAPVHAGAFKKGESTWIVLTEKEPTLKDWAASAAPEDTGRQWCEKEKAA